MNNTIHDLIMKRPASTFRNRWMDGTIIGSGKTGIVLYGGATSEHFIINRSDLWFCGKDGEVPNVAYCLEKMREMQEKGDFKNAQYVMWKELIEKGYSTTLADMRALGCVKLVFPTTGVYSDYKRVLHMDTSEAEISYKIDGKAFNRRNFMSRERDIAIIEMNSEEKSEFILTSGFFDSFEGGREITTKENDLKNAEYSTYEDCHIYSSCNEGKYFGIVCRVVSDGLVCCDNSGIKVQNSTKTLLLIKAFSEEEDRKAAEYNNAKALCECNADYKTLFEENLPQYQKYYFSSNISLYNGSEFHTNEYLLEDARTNKMSCELAEKMWRFGRYFFISSTAVGALPCPLYGIWPSGYQREYTHHVANENVQSIYWHTDVGGLSELVVPLIDYYYNKMDSFRENARNLFGCNGIFVGTYTTPKNGAVAWYVPVILHFTGVAGWLSSHFYKYYQYTRDEKLFKEKILPFMVEAAQFYEDYYYVDKEGKFTLYPGVSPENSPFEYYSETDHHSMTVAKNPTVDIAIIKELLTNLIKESETHISLKEKAGKWKEILDILPEYLVNEDGAVKEWLCEELSDSYKHRHISHLYPVFPGTEIEDSKDLLLKAAFKRAVDLRGFGAFCGWSMPHLSAIYSRLGESDKAFYTLNALTKVCVLENFFTLGHDFRDMGITGFDCGDEFNLSVQFDALLSFINAIQEMLIFSTEKILRILPACPKEFSKGKANFRFNSGIIQVEWDLETNSCKGVITALRDTEFSLELPFATKPKSIVLEKGEKYEF